jgi:replicative DNA helicase
MTEAFDRIPPHDTGAETALLGSLVLVGNDHAHFDRSTDGLWLEAFYLQDHQILYDALTRLRRAGQPLDGVTVAAQLRDMGQWEEVGGLIFLTQTMAGAFPAHARHYAERVIEMGRRRSAVTTASKLIERMFQPDGDTGELLRAAAAEFVTVASRGQGVELLTLGEVGEAFEAERQKHGSTAIDTGLTSLDARFPGLLRLGGYTVVAARPSVGKSAFVKDMALRLCRRGVAVGLVAVEENRGKVYSDMAANATGVTNWIVRDGGRTADQQAEIKAFIAEMHGRPFWMTDKAVSIGNVVNATEQLVDRHKCQVVIIDHMHLIGDDGAARQYVNAHRQFTEISATLKHAFKRLDVAGVVAAQLNRAGADRPQLHQLRESGSIEEHIDVGLFLHREDYAHRGESGYSPNGDCEVLVLKNRGGPCGNATLKFLEQHQRFTDPATSWAGYQTETLPEGI